VESIAALVRARGGRMTAPRRALLSALLSPPAHHTAEQLLGEIRGALPNVDESTIYRNLGQLEEMGVVAHVHLSHGRAVYHLAGEDHAHIVCTGCGLVEEISAGSLAAVREAVTASGTNFALSWQHFAWTGLCAGCRAAQRPR